MAIFIQKHFVKFDISESLRGQRQATGIFNRLKALDTLPIIYHWKVFFSLISKKCNNKLLLSYIKQLFIKK